MGDDHDAAEMGSILRLGPGTGGCLDSRTSEPTAATSMNTKEGEGEDEAYLKN